MAAVTLALESRLLEVNPLQTVNTSAFKRARQCDRSKRKTLARLKFDTICLNFKSAAASSKHTHEVVCTMLECRLRSQVDLKFSSSKNSRFQEANR